MKKSRFYYAKASFLSLILFLGSFYISKITLDFVKSGQYFVLNYDFFAIIASVLFVVIVANSLLVGTWGKWEQYVFTPLTISLGIFLNLFSLNPVYATSLFILIYILIFNEAYFANQLKNQLLVFNPRFVLKNQTRMILFCFALSAGAMTLLSSKFIPPYNVGYAVGQVTDNYVTPYINYEISENFSKVISQQNNIIALDSETKKLLEANGDLINGMFLNKISIGTAPKLKLSPIIEQKVNDAIEPYKRLINPILALYILSVVQFVGIFSYLFYSMLVDVIFWIAKKTKFIMIEKIPTEKEELFF